MRRSDWLCLGALGVIVACGSDVTYFEGGGGDAGEGDVGGEGATSGPGGGPSGGSGPSGSTHSSTSTTGSSSGQTSSGTGPTTVTTTGAGGMTSSSGSGGMTSSSGTGGMTSSSAVTTSGSGGMTSSSTSGTGGMTSSVATSTSSGPMPCVHDECTEGAALDPMCSPCAGLVCAQDPFCCQVFWDGLCVSESEQLCGLNCPTCHDICMTGGPIDAVCDPCADAVCMVDPTCCTVAWDGGCVQLVLSVCMMGC